MTSPQWRRRLAPCLAALSAAAIAGQPAPSVATTLAAIERYPTFFHGRTVSLVSTPSKVNGIWHLPIAAPRRFVLVPRSGSLPTRPVELRGQVFDVGQLAQDDSRLAMSGLREVIQSLYGDRWPPRTTLFALVNASWAEDEPRALSLRAIVLHPDAFAGRTVAVRGRFRARNPYGDLPAWPRHSEWDFVLQASDAAIWVSGLRPRGRGFDLDPTERRGSGTWLEVKGTIQVADALIRLEAASIATTSPVTELPPAPAEIVPELPPPAVVFSAPLDGETGVDPTAPIRIQFSRSMKPETIESGIRITYAAEAVAAVPAFTVMYRAQTRAVEIRFKTPLESSAAIVVTLADSITAVEGTPLVPTSITFRTK